MITLPSDPDPLFAQCFDRIRTFLAPEEDALTPLEMQALAEWISQRVRLNEKRINRDSPSHEVTGVPTPYIDDVIRFFRLERRRLIALADGDSEAWESLLKFMSLRATQYLLRYGVRDDDLAEMRDDMVQICAETFLRNIDRFPYDCSLDAWVSKLVANKVREVCRAHGFRRQHIIYLPIEADEHSPFLSTIGIDNTFMAAEARLVLEGCLMQLSEDQRLLIQLEADGNDVEGIAQAMGRTSNAVYKLRQRAYATLQSLRPAV